VAAAKRFNAGVHASAEIRGEAFNVFDTIDVNDVPNLSLLPSNSRTLQLRVSF
jgi:hypothetical protein